MIKIANKEMKTKADSTAMKDCIWAKNAEKE